MTRDLTSNLQAAIPILLTGDLTASVGFFGRLDFAVRYDDGDYAILERDGVELHFSAVAGLDPKRNGSECRVNVRDVAALYDAFPAAAMHPNGAPLPQALRYEGVRRARPRRHLRHVRRGR